MLIFRFLNARTGEEIHVSSQRLSADCGGACCFDRAVADFRQLYPNFTPGDEGVTIEIRGRADA